MEWCFFSNRSIFLSFTICLLLFTILIAETESKSTAGKIVKNAAKAYTNHRAARSVLSIWKFLFFIVVGIVTIIAIGAAIIYLKRRFFSGSTDEFVLLRESS